MGHWVALVRRRLITAAHMLNLVMAQTIRGRTVRGRREAVFAVSVTALLLVQIFTFKIPDSLNLLC